MSDINIQLTVRRSGLDVAQKWEQQYFRNGKWGSTVSGSAENTYNAILAAGDDPDKIDKAIDNESWTKPFCCACSNYFTVGVNMLEPDYETTPTFCSDCIKKAYELCFGTP